MMQPTRAELWARFAAAAMGVGDANENTALSARAADRMLVEFEKRFAQHGLLWIERSREIPQ